MITEGFYYRTNGKTPLEALELCATSEEISEVINKSNNSRFWGKDRRELLRAAQERRKNLPVLSPEMDNTSAAGDEGESRGN